MTWNKTSLLWDFVGRCQQKYSLEMWAETLGGQRERREARAAEQEIRANNNIRESRLQSEPAEIKSEQRAAANIRLAAQEGLTRKNDSEPDSEPVTHGYKLK